MILEAQYIIAFQKQVKSKAIFSIEVIRTELRELKKSKI